MEKLKLYNHPTEMQDKINELVNNVNIVSDKIETFVPTDTIQSILDKGLMHGIVYGTLGTYLVLIFPIYTGHSTVRFFSTEASISSRKAPDQLNTSTLAQALTNATMTSDDTIIVDITALFANYLSSLSALGLTQISWTKTPTIQRNGLKRVITGTLKIVNETGSDITVPASLKMASLSLSDYSNAPGFNAFDVTTFNGIAVYQDINEHGDLFNYNNQIVQAGSTRYINLNFDYSL